MLVGDELTLRLSDQERDRQGLLDHFTPTTNPKKNSVGCQQSIAREITKEKEQFYNIGDCSSSNLDVVPVLPINNTLSLACKPSSPS